MTIVEFPDFESHARDTGIILKGKTLTCNHPSSTIILISTPPHSKSFCDSDTKKPYKWYKRWKTNTIYPSSSLLRTNIPYKISLVFVCRELANNSLRTYPLFVNFIDNSTIILSSLLLPSLSYPAPHYLIFTISITFSVTGSNTTPYGRSPFRGRATQNYGSHK